MSKIDFKAINQSALNAVNSVLNKWVPSGNLNGNEWVALNPTRNDSSKGSFSINISTGVWKDFSTGDGGADLISLVAYIEGTKQLEAAKSLSSFLVISYSQTSKPLATSTRANVKIKEFTLIYPPPKAAGIHCPKIHPKNGKPTQYWDYFSTEGHLLIRIMRFDSNKRGQRKKDYRPLAYGKLGDGSPSWHWRQIPKDRPLYRLNKLKNQTTAVICEGEKAADAATKLFPDYFVTCWSGGSKAVSKTDFSPIKHCNIVVWPDNDHAGTETIGSLKTKLESLGISRFEVIDNGFFKLFSPLEHGKYQNGGTWPDKADAVEACELGWTSVHMKTAIENNELFARKESLPIDETDGVPYGYKLDESGLWFNDGKASKKLCAPIKFIARSRSGLGDGRNWGILIRFNDFDSQEKIWNIPMLAFATDGGAEVIRGLLDRGLPISAMRDAKKKILEYLQEYETERRVSLVYKMGWFKNAFVLPDSVIGSKQNVMYYSESPNLCKLSSKGSVTEWRDNVAKYCVGNPLALFAISAAFSAPLVELMGYESMGFHFYGDSSWGKSTLLNMACSVYGNPEEYKCTFRATDNALESLASAHSDMLLALDEINQVDSRIIGDIIYMLGNGQGKHRANDRGQARETQHKWKLTYLTNGEKTLEQYLLEGGKKVTGGMEMRFLGIRASLHSNEEDKKRMGVFNNDHGLGGGAALSGLVKNNMCQYFGSAFPHFLNHIIEFDRSTLVTELNEIIQTFVSNNVTSKAGGQVQRAAAKFALVGLAGELATQHGLTGWKLKDAYNAARTCFRNWIASRGGEGNMEDAQIFNEFRLQLQMYGDSRFKRWDNETPSIDTHVPSPVESWGFRKHLDTKDIAQGDSQDVIYYIYTNVFEQVICKGNDHLRIARLLRDKGALMLRDGERKENRLKTKERLPGTGNKQTYIYKVKGSILFGDDDKKSIE